MYIKSVCSALSAQLTGAALGLLHTCSGLTDTQRILEPRDSFVPVQSASNSLVVCSTLPHQPLQLSTVTPSGAGTQPCMQALALTIGELAA